MTINLNGTKTKNKTKPEAFFFFAEKDNLYSHGDMAKANTVKKTGNSG